MVGDFLAEMQAFIYIKKLWQPHPTREGGIFLMDAFRAHMASSADLAHINTCRMYLHVLTILDITDLQGCTVLVAVLRGGGGASSLLYPPKHFPPSHA